MKTDMIDKTGMIDISEKKDVKRTAVACGRICLKEETVSAIKNKTVKKGDVLAASEITAMIAAKDTSRLIPLCHNISLAKISVDFEIGTDFIDAKVTVISIGKTGVEMEALTGVTLCLLNIWDMVKYLEKDEHGLYPTAKITDIRVTKKTKEEI